VRTRTRFVLFALSLFLNGAVLSALALGITSVVASPGEWLLAYSMMWLLTLPGLLVVALLITLRHSRSHDGEIVRIGSSRYFLFVVATSVAGHGIGWALVELNVLLWPAPPVAA